MNKFFTIVLALFLGATMYAQTTVTGTVTDSNDGQPIPGASIKVEGKALGTTTDFDGKYKLQVSQEVPFKVVFSNLGYVSQTVEITKNDQVVDIAMTEADNTLDEVVISASRTPESIRESPVTIERMDVRDIKNASAPSFYQSIGNLKGVDVNTGSLTFNSVNTRGFATFANTRFVQLIDGMDNASPMLNFVLGNLVGMNELDINSVELLPGASSALYGANAFNGILFMTSKSPFDDPGISVYLKTGLTMQEEAGDNNFYDVGVRAAYAFSEKFAAKASLSYMKGTDWYATDFSQYVPNEAGEVDTNLAFGSSNAHDGLNIYGDEITSAASLPPGVNMDLLAASLGFPLIDLGTGTPILDGSGMGNVGRTGYREQDLTDYEARSVKFDGSLNFRPFANDFEIIWNSRVGFGNTIYQGANRYSLNNFLMQQHKLEIRNDNFFLRGYVTSEAAGDSYDMRFTGINMSKEGAGTWFGTYASVFAQNFNANGNNRALAHSAARQFADANVTIQPGTPEFKTLFDKVTSDPDVATGSKFLDNTKLYHGEGNYNFSSLLNDAVNLQVGGNYRQYSLNSGGTIFTDYDGSIEYNEIGAYMQASKKLADERLKLTGSIRYDKNDFFDGNISPRASLVYSAGENKQHNFRVSFQTGFRNPDTQSLFIGLNVGRAILVGSSPDNLDRRLPTTNGLTGRDAYNDAYSASSFKVFTDYLETDAFTSEVISYITQGFTQEQATGLAIQDNLGKIKSTKTELVQPEEVTAYDIGYRGKLGKVSIDFNAYYNSYKGFIANKTVLAPVNGSALDGSGYADVAAALPLLIASGGTFDTNFLQPFQTYTNSKGDVSSYGATIGLDTKVGGFNVGANYTYAKLDFDQVTDPDFQAGFNTPEHKVKVSFGHHNLFENFGFNVNARWSDEYFWQSSSVNFIVPSRTVVDAQINYSVPKIKSTFKIGGSNLGGKEYQSAPGAGFIGSQYYVSWVINQ